MNPNKSTTTSSNVYTSHASTSLPHVEHVMLPTERVELPASIHEEIRNERVQEIQPIVNVEKLKTQVIQKTQPLMDKEVRAVQVENRTLAAQVLPEVNLPSRGAPVARDVSTVSYRESSTVVVEKPAVINEVDKTRIIEEIQPVIYKETVVPTVIKETKPVYQKVVEGPTYSQETLPMHKTATYTENVPLMRDTTPAPLPTFSSVNLPTERVNLPASIHEEIRNERVEEIQPIVNVEKLKTQVIQKTQPLLDKEVRAVQVENRTLDAQYLPEVNLPSRGVPVARDVSTVSYREASTVVVEKPAIYNEVDRTRVIEEIQPVIYKETVVPTLIKETKPVYQKIVEGPTYAQETLPMHKTATYNDTVPQMRDTTPAPLPTFAAVSLPTERVELPASIHEEIRNERVEEIQPVINVEKLKTQVIQKTQPLLDKEVRPVVFESRTRETEILPEVNLPSRGVAAARDVSTVSYREASTVVIEKPAVVNEVDKTRIIEEIQPVIYKETIVPTLIHETKQIYQKIVEGPTYVHETLPVQQLHGSHYSYPATSSFTTVNAPMVTPMATGVNVPITPLVTAPVNVPVTPLVTAPLPSSSKGLFEHPQPHHKKVIEETTTTTTTTVSGGLPLPNQPLSK